MREFQLSARITEDGEETVRVSMDADYVVIDTFSSKVVLTAYQWSRILAERSRFERLRAEIVEDDNPPFLPLKAAAE